MSALEFAGVREEQRALDVLVTAFTADPVIRWMYPDATGYLTHFPAFLRAFGGKAFTSKTVWRSASSRPWPCGSPRTLNPTATL